MRIYITLLDEEHEQSFRESVIECYLACHCSTLGQVCLQSKARLNLVAFPLTGLAGWSESCHSHACCVTLLGKLTSCTKN